MTQESTRAAQGAEIESAEKLARRIWDAGYNLAASYQEGYLQEYWGQLIEQYAAQIAAQARASALIVADKLREFLTPRSPMYGEILFRRCSQCAGILEWYMDEIASRHMGHFPECPLAPILAELDALAAAEHPAPAPGERVGE